MPIIHMHGNDQAQYPEGAYCLLPAEAKHHGWDHLPERHERSALTGKPYWTGVLILSESHQGLCLQDREANGYDDSDWYMLVWNPEKGAPEEVLFASTRGWSYPCYASQPDATPEVRAAYEAWRQADARRRRIQNRWDARRADTLLAQALGLPSRAAAIKLREALGQHRAPTVKSSGKGLVIVSHSLNPCNETFLAVAKLLQTRAFKSTFRASLADHVRSWVRDPAPKYPAPLSGRQLATLRF